VAEWCQDWYERDYYDRSPVDDPPGPGVGLHRVLRGGSWLVNDANCRAASRFFLTPGDTSHYIGFRVARSP
jgi:formylglycine-generating enzyme required for sulfatase activity